MKGEDIRENAIKTNIYSHKTIVKLLIYLKKIRKASDYEDWAKALKSSLFEWFLITFVIRAFVIFMCLWLITFSFVTPKYQLILLAEGLSILWYLIIDFKRDIFKRGD